MCKRADEGRCPSNSPEFTGKMKRDPCGGLLPEVGLPSCAVQRGEPK